jgi:hypothetical protein
MTGDAMARCGAACRREAGDLSVGGNVSWRAAAANRPPRFIEKWRRVAGGQRADESRIKSLLRP